MVVIDKAREYLRSIADSEEHYNYLINNVMKRVEEFVMEVNRGNQ